MTKKGVLFRLSTLGGPTKKIQYAFMRLRNTVVWVHIVTQNYKEIPRFKLHNGRWQTPSIEFNGILMPDY